MIETRRRTLTKTVAWRLIGIVWTWIGAYLILLLTPGRYRSAAVLSGLIVVFHHSTRMIMYYGYERAWNAVGWGKVGPGESPETTLSPRAQLAWGLATLAALILIGVLIFYITPLIKP